MLTEKIYEAAKAAGCEAKVLEAKEIIAYLKENKTRNVAVLGETNSGKTTLINTLCGKEVRAATKLSLGEKPLKVVFSGEEKDDNYEIVKVENENYADVTFNEIPINEAIDYETKMPTAMLEKTDVVIYVVSAVMAMTASDIDTISNLMNKFPIIIYISKTDVLENAEEVVEVVDYVRDMVARTFNNVEMPIFATGDETVNNSIMEIIKGMEFDGIREFHIEKIVADAKQTVLDALNDKLNSFKEARAIREKEIADAEDELRDERLAWDKLRIEMLERSQETVDAIDNKMRRIKMATKQKLENSFNEAQNKNEWLKNDFKNILSDELENAARAVFDEATEITSSHGNWFIERVSEKYNKSITVEDLKCYYSTPDINLSDDENNGPDRKKMYIGAGSGLLAGVAIFSLPIIPAAIIAIPATLAAVTFIKGSIDDNERYNKSVLVFVNKANEENFAKLASDIHLTVNAFYEKIIASMHSIVSGKKPTVDFSDIEAEENAIMRMINEVE